MVISLKLQQRVDEFAESLREEFGSQITQGSHDCLLSAIEDFGVQVGDKVAKRVAEVEAAEHVSKAEHSECCPDCSSPGALKDERKRLLDGRRGKLRISEPEYFCSKCRKSFFPSNAVDRRGPRLHPDARIAEESGLRGSSR